MSTREREKGERHVYVYMYFIDARKVPRYTFNYISLALHSIAFAFDPHSRGSHRSIPLMV